MVDCTQALVGRQAEVSFLLARQNLIERSIGTDPQFQSMHESQSSVGTSRKCVLMYSASRKFGRL